eukprot:scaffold81971_cov51-Prasinocladus_malaysianus.AAC.1
MEGTLQYTGALSFPVTTPALSSWRKLVACLPPISPPSSKAINSDYSYYYVPRVVADYDIG